MSAVAITPTKSRHGENFPVASLVIRARHRPAILAFYDFARAADDVADSPSLSPDDKLARLEALRAGLAGEAAEPARAAALRTALTQRGLTPAHALDLLEAFRRDVRRSRYASWDDLMDYCRYSAAPVGRLVLDVHGESAVLWPLSDALCAALQVINHLQDCGKDYREIDRVYIPLDALGGLGVEALAAPRAGPELRAVIAGLARRTSALLEESRPLARRVADRRLGLEIAVIQRLAESLAARLARRDPLSERVHHTRLEMGALGLSVLIRGRTAGGAA